jgi:hypothetical protein
MNQVLFRFPFSGVSTHSYRSDFSGKLCQAAYIISRLALLAISILLIAQAIPVTYAFSSVIVLSAVPFFAHLLGSSKERKVGETLFEFAICSVCCLLASLSAAGLLTGVACGAGIFTTLFGVLLLGIPLERGGIVKIERENIEEYVPPTPICLLDYLIGVARDGEISLISWGTGIINRSYYVDEIDQKEADGLCVLVHGLASRPSVLDRFREKMEQSGLNITVFQPYVTKNGLCSLDEASAQIEAEVLKWATAHPGKPIIWIGHSNGARISGNLSAKLKIENPMQVHCVTGPFEGTTFIDRSDWPEMIRGHWEWLFRTLYSDEVYEELSYRSEHSQSVVSRMREVSTSVSFHFYASASDALVFPFTSSMPEMGNAHYYLSYGEGHQGILAAAEKTIVENSLSFINSFSVLY